MAKTASSSENMVKWITGPGHARFHKIKHISTSSKHATFKDETRLLVS